MVGRTATIKKSRMTQEELDKLKLFFTSNDLESFELGKEILIANLTPQEIKLFLHDLNTSQDDFEFKVKKGIGIFRFYKKNHGLTGI